MLNKDKDNIGDDIYGVPLKDSDNKKKKQGNRLDRFLESRWFKFLIAVWLIATFIFATSVSTSLVIQLLIGVAGIAVPPAATIVISGIVATVEKIRNLKRNKKIFNELYGKNHTFDEIENERSKKTTAEIQDDYAKARPKDIDKALSYMKYEKKEMERLLAKKRYLESLKTNNDANLNNSGSLEEENPSKKR